MKKIFALLSIIAVICTFAATKAFTEDDSYTTTNTTSYTLTVASSNPSSGVSVSVSPVRPQRTGQRQDPVHAKLCRRRHGNPYGPLNSRQPLLPEMAEERG